MLSRRTQLWDTAIPSRIHARLNLTQFVEFFGVYFDSLLYFGKVVRVIEVKIIEDMTCRFELLGAKWQ